MREAGLECSIQMESQKDLSAKDQEARLVKRSLDLAIVDSVTVAANAATFRSFRTGSRRAQLANSTNAPVRRTRNPESSASGRQSGRRDVCARPIWGQTDRVV